ncbi:MAG: low molecular weight protein arginine phosphatase [Tissierellia bacterium]|nr:low molecular weight protein arginine phosphatase [Tissierellia bacterium]MDD4436723.1 low molecular weight protein arginine phosphatase [Tissierellia bacterium]
MNILFVCTGNTCRSPMAEGIFKDMLKKNNIDNIIVSSAGLSVFPGEHANEKAVKALKEKGIDITMHRARQLLDEINKADLILTMTLSHKQVISDYFKSKTDETSPCLSCLFTLKEFAAKLSGEKLTGTDIDDPYGRDYNFYKDSRDEIEMELIKILKNLNKLEGI